jgi:hypothetical protein
VPKRRVNTKVIVNGKDVSSLVFSCNLDRMPSHDVETVTLELEVDKLRVADDGTLLVYVQLPEVDA